MLGDRLGHEGGVHAEFAGRLAGEALEQHDLVGEAQRIAMREIDLQLARAGFVGQGLERQRCRRGVFVDAPDHTGIFVERFQPIGMLRGLGAARAAERRRQRQVRIGIGRREIEFHFRRHHGPPAALAEQIDDAFQHVARRHRPRPAVGMMGVGQHTGLRRTSAGRQAQRRHIRLQKRVRILVRHLVGAGVAAGDGDDEGAHRQEDRRAFERSQELGDRQHLAAQDAVDVGHQAFDFGDGVLLQPLPGIIHAAPRALLFAMVAHRDRDGPFQ